MQHLDFEPPEELSDSVNCFWHVSKDFGDTLSAFEVVPDGFAEIIFYSGSLGSMSDSGVLQPLPSPFMVGLLNQPVHFYTRNRLNIISVRCYPWTVFDLLGLPSGKDGVRVFEHPVAQLQPALNSCMNAGKIEEAVALIKQYFLAARAKIGINSMLYKAGVAMRNANGTIPVSQVAAAAHATVRTLERKFKQSSGYSVKDVSGLMRFEQVRNRLWFNPDTGIAGLAPELGYADQAHLSKEFKRYSGTTPAAFARKAKKRQQAVSGDFVVFVQD